jgi:signal transduction histidine kinase
LLSGAEFIHRIDQLMRPTLEARGIAYSSSVEPSDLTVTADGGLLEQVLINLLHNAMEALSAAPDPRIEVRCRVRDEHCSGARATVSAAGMRLARAASGCGDRVCRRGGLHCAVGALGMMGVEAALRAVVRPGVPAEPVGLGAALP